MMPKTANALVAALQALSPTHLHLENESHMHAGYFEGKESHFKLTIVSDAFVGKRLAARHQQVYALVDAQLTRAGGTVHALAIHAYTPDEWSVMTTSPNSPLCASRQKIS